MNLGERRPSVNVMPDPVILLYVKSISDSGEVASVKEEESISDSGEVALVTFVSCFVVLL